jgi:hypothetical protein
MIAIGTPKGRNWFYRWFQQGQSSDHPDVASWQAPTKQNPYVPDSEIEAAKEDMPDRVFNQEYRAEFVDDTGSAFGDIREKNVEDYSLPVSIRESTSPYRIGLILLVSRTGLLSLSLRATTAWWRLSNSSRHHGIGF